MRELRKHADLILRAALEAADPAKAVERAVEIRGDVLFAGRKRYPLALYKRILVIGAGKASAAMASALEKRLAKRITSGLLNVKYGHTASLKRIALNQCGHPVPDEAGVEGSARIADLARQAAEDDLIICLLSGGGSALMPAPAEGLTLMDKQETTRLLLACGATIHEINAVRKHLSLLKGGQLARLAWPATVITLILSDVIGDNLDVIASGPTAPDSSTFHSAIAVLKKYELLAKVPGPVRQRLEEGSKGKIAETPKPGAKELARTENLVIGSNRLAVDAAQKQARDLGYRTMVLSTTIEGETRDVAGVHAAIAREIRESARPLRAPACIISGGETTVTLKGDGKGGRNQEFALAAALALNGQANTVMVSIGTDGSDGPTDAAGAYADSTTLTRAAKLNLSPAAYLANNDSYHFFEALGDLVKTGPTNTNVMDVRLVLVGVAE
jgi:glycerate 2-kinase